MHDRIQSVHLCHESASHAQALLMIPTYNETENIQLLIEAITKVGFDIDLFFIDDGSPDGTSEKIVAHAHTTQRNVYLMRRTGKFGLSTAYTDAMTWALKHLQEHRIFIQMDADLSHDPKTIPLLAQYASAYGVTVGSRYVQGGAIPDWSLRRYMLSCFGNIYTRMVLRLFFPSYRIKDSTSGFVAWRRDIAERVFSRSITSEGYAYQIATKVIAYELGFPAIEIPIIFRDRKRGMSKMSYAIIKEALHVPWQLGLKRIKRDRKSFQESNKKRILICVETVDAEDRAYGFFVAWLQELERQGVRALIICLRKGAYPMFKQHRIIQLPERFPFKSLRRAWALWRISWNSRHEYDAVFVRQAPIFMVVGGLLWRLLKKRTVLWYAHYTGNRLLRPAAFISNMVVTSVPEACRISSKQVVPIGQAIDTERFKISTERSFDGFQTIVLGRVSHIKRVANIVRTFSNSKLARKGELFIVGPPLDSDETKAVTTEIAGKRNVHWRKEGIAHKALPEFLSDFDFMINFYQGSLDKAILEAMACGVIPIIATDAAESLLPHDLHWLIARDEAGFHKVSARIVELKPSEREMIAMRLRSIVVQEHSLVRQVRCLVDILFSPNEKKFSPTPTMKDHNMLARFQSSVHKVLVSSQRYFKTDMVYLVKGMSWLTSSKIIGSLTAVGLAIMYANFLSKEEYGLYKYILATVGILRITSLPGMDVSLTRSIIRGYEGTLNKIIKVKIKFSILGTIIGLCISGYYFYSKNPTLGLGFFVASLFFPVIDSLIYDSYLEAKKLFKEASIVSSLNQIFVFFAIGITLIAWRNVLALIFVYFFSLSLLKIIFFKYIFRKYTLNQNEDKEAVALGKHFSVMGVLGLVASQIDKIFMWHFIGPAELAIYSFATVPITQSQSLLKSVFVLAFPKIAEQNTELLKKTLPVKALKFSFILMVPVTLYIFAAPWLFQTIFPQYIDSVRYSQLFSLTLLLFPFRVFSYPLLVEAKKKSLYFQQTIIPLIQIILLFILLPIYGIYGAITALLLSSSIGSLILYYQLKIM